MENTGWRNYILVIEDILTLVNFIGPNSSAWTRSAGLIFTGNCVESVGVGVVFWAVVC